MYQFDRICSYYSLNVTYYLQHHSDKQIGVHVIDSWTYYALEFLNSITASSHATMQQFVSPSNHLLATVAMLPYLIAGFI